MKLFLVDTVSSFRNSYAIRAKSGDDAMDSVTMEEAEEFGQEWLGESISRVMEITEEQYLEMFDKDNDYLMSWTDERKKNAIEQVKYEDASYDPIKSPIEI